uniref:Uncharacterized protein n=1 Tax=Romanomermis culicivorax TaxID=13658 RepID=A0A915K659_ROMCU
MSIIKERNTEGKERKNQNRKQMQVGEKKNSTSHEKRMWNENRQQTKNGGTNRNKEMKNVDNKRKKYGRKRKPNQNRKQMQVGEKKNR